MDGAIGKFSLHLVRHSLTRQQFIVITIILIVQLGYSALPGIAFLALCMPIQASFMRKLFGYRKKSMIWTDKRAKLLQEILGGMRIVKFMAWENSFLERLKTIRSLEIRYVRSLLWARSGMMAFALSLPVLAAILSFITYSLTSHELEAATVFSVITLFQLMRMPLMIWPMSLSTTADAINAIGRLQKVYEAEVVSEEKAVDPSMHDAVRVEHASFTWDAAPVATDDKEMKKLNAKQAKRMGVVQGAEVSKEKKKLAAKIAKKKDKVDLATETEAEAAGGAGGQGLDEADVAKGGAPEHPGAVVADGKVSHEAEEKIFKLKDIELSIPRGGLTAIVGTIGSGKSSLLQGLMGEMRRTEGKVTFSGSTSLCAQTPWIQNATVREVSILP
jgi:ABC-type multidrug transport system fused ATPase/permease subunit